MDNQKTTKSATDSTQPVAGRIFGNNISIKDRHRKGCLGWFLIILAILIGLGIFWGISVWRTPLSESFIFSSGPSTIKRTSPNLQIPTLQATMDPDKKPVCGNESEWFVMLVGLDSREQGSEYLYGLADVIRIARVDFTVPSVNVVSFSRAMLVEIPEDHILVEGPLLINQSYFYGARGMGYYTGSAFGAGSLAETIQYNFGITADHYLVVNFQAFVSFVDAIGGIDVDLPSFVDDMPSSYFPAGAQHLDGERALTLARIRKKYSDLARINNQTIVINAIIQKLQDPAIISRIPSIYASFVDSVLTDASPAQLNTALCLLNKLDGTNLKFFDAGWDLLTDGWEFIPTLQKDMEIIRWDQNFVNWLYASLWSK